MLDPEIARIAGLLQFNMPRNALVIDLCEAVKKAQAVTAVVTQSPAGAKVATLVTRKPLRDRASYMRDYRASKRAAS